MYQNVSLCILLVLLTLWTCSLLQFNNDVQSGFFLGETIYDQVDLHHC